MNWAPIAIAVSLFSLLVNLAVAAVVGLIRLQARSDNALLKNEISALIRAELDRYIGRQQFNDYMEAHAKEHEFIKDHMTRHRDWKHDTADPLLRLLQMRVEDLKVKAESKEGSS